MKANSNYSSTQQSPMQFLVHSSSYLSNLYAYMFIEDFCRAFSIEFSADWHNRDFYSVEPAGDQLGKYLSFQNYNFFQYDFEKIIEDSMYSLLIKGEAYIEIIFYKDSTNEVKGISLLPLRIEKSQKRVKNISFAGMTQDKKHIKFQIERSKLVVLTLKDLGFSKKYFTKLFKKMTKLDVSASGTSLIENHAEIGYDFSEHVRMVEYKLLKVNDRTFWMGRKHNNQHLSESYLLYRIANIKKLRLVFLEYILTQINNALKPFQDELLFKGKIVSKLPLIDYDHCLDLLSKGEINTTDAGNIIINSKKQ